MLLNRNSALRTEINNEFNSPRTLKNNQTKKNDDKNVFHEYLSWIDQKTVSENANTF